MKVILHWLLLPTICRMTNGTMSHRYYLGFSFSLRIIFYLSITHWRCSKSLKKHRFSIKNNIPFLSWGLNHLTSLSRKTFLTYIVVIVLLGPLSMPVAVESCANLDVSQRIETAFFQFVAIENPLNTVDWLLCGVHSLETQTQISC